MKTFKSFITEKVDKKDVVSFDIPLLIRVLEYTREDLKSDVNLHKMVERLISIRNKGTLTMADYTFVTRLKEEYIEEEGRCWDGYKPAKGKKAYAKGSCVKEDGMAIAGPTNVVGAGAIAGTGGKGGEPGVGKKRKPLLQDMAKRRLPQ